MASKEEKRIEILLAAARVFSEHGFEGAKIEEIAKEAGIGKGTVYEYFESKKVLFEEMVRHNANQYIKGLVNVLEAGENFREKLMNFSVYQAEFLVDHINMIEVAMRSNLLPKELRYWLMEEKETIFRTIQNLVAEGMEKGELRKDADSEVAAFSILGTIAQHHAKKLLFDRLDISELNHTKVVDVIIKGLV